MKKIISYNVNGIRAAQRKGLFDWMNELEPDIVCLQETKAQENQLEDEISTLHKMGFHTYWYSAEKKGYSGVAIFSKEKPLNIHYGCGIEKYDREGRILRADFEKFSIISAYFPSGSSGDLRQAFKEEFLEDIYAYTKDLLSSFPRLIIAGDYNICHKEIDIHDPVRNKKSSGFLPHERAWVSKFLELGFTDSFRKFNQDPHHYSWWSFRANARANNKGWRIDYQMITDELARECIAAEILPDVKHSDHCPISLDLDV